MNEDELILTHILKCSRSELYLQKPQLTDQQQKQFQEYKDRRLQGEPLQYILGSCNFMGLELAVNFSVLVPRPETEQLVDEALQRFKGGQVLDLGTGSGCIAVAIAKFCPQAQVTAIDLSPEAIAIARINAQAHGVDERINFIETDILIEGVILSVAKPACRQAGIVTSLDSSPALERDQNDSDVFDLIISNPPYIPSKDLSQLPQDVQQEPPMALDGGADGLDFYRSIIKLTPRLLRTGAYLMMEFGDGQGLAVKNLIVTQQVFSSIQILQDLAGKDRIICAQKI